MIGSKRLSPLGAGLGDLFVDEFDLEVVVAGDGVAAGEFQTLDVQSECNSAIAELQLGAGS
jgi:hypothetical protein